MVSALTAGMGDRSKDDGYKWVALANTTAAVFMSALDGSIALIALPAIFHGIHLDPLAAGNISYLLWMIMGYRLVQAILVVTLGRLGDMFGRVRIYNAGFAVSIARGGLQFMLIIWLQGIWLPLHGYNYSDTPLWAGIFLLPLTVGFLIAGPVAGTLSDRFGSRGLVTAGALVFGGSFLGLTALPVDFPYGVFALLIFANGIASGMFAAPNSSSIMSSVPASQRGVASGMRATFQNSGTALSIGAFFSLMIAGLARSLPKTLTSGLRQQGVPHGVAQQVGALPPVSSLFAAILGANPIQQLLKPSGALSALPAANQHTLTGRQFFPNLISEPFHQGLVIVFAAAALAVLAALASLLRGGRNVHIGSTTDNAPVQTREAAHPRSGHAEDAYRLPPPLTRRTNPGGSDTLRTRGYFSQDARDEGL